MSSRRSALAATIVLLLLLPAALAHYPHGTASDRTISGGAAGCDTSSGVPVANAQVTQQPFNYSVVGADHGKLTITLSSTFFGAVGDSCVVTLTFTGARYGTLIGTGSGSATAVVPTNTQVLSSAGPSGSGSVEIDWQLDFPPTVYLWADYTISVTATSGATGLTSTATASGTIWLYEPSVPLRALGLEEP